MNNIPSSFCTICTSPASFELVGLLLSLSVFHPSATVYIVADTQTQLNIRNLSPTPNLIIKWIIELDKYSSLTRSQMEDNQSWAEFQMFKSIALDYALQFEEDCLFLDSDIIITEQINGIDKTKELGVSPHYMRKDILDKFGNFNGGMLWTRNKMVPHDWREFTKTSRYYDQASIEDLARKYDHFSFGKNYNIQGYRLALHEHGPQSFVHSLSVNKAKSEVFYDNQVIKCIHTHFRNQSEFGAFNHVMLSLFAQANMYKILCIIHRVIHDKWVIKIPKQPQMGMGQHTNDSFREIPSLWEIANKDIQVIHDPNTIHCWLGDRILLYDRDTPGWINSEVNTSCLLLMGNGDMKTEGVYIQSKFPNVIVKPWIYWARHPAILEKIVKEHGILSYEGRTNTSIFIGNFENNVQKQFRDLPGKVWENVITEFYVQAGSIHKFSQEEYLHKLRQSKYGLCLRGYGSKCHREIELMAFGTVPVITSHVCTDSFTEPLMENVHYIMATPENFLEKIDSISMEKWEFLSRNCVEWYLRNVDSLQSWSTMISRILYTPNIKN